MIDYVHFADFYKPGVDRQLKIDYNGGTITNADLNGESGFKLEEVLCSGEQLKFGSVGSAKLTLRLVKPSVYSFVAADLTVSMTLNNDTANPFGFGTFEAVSDTPDREGYYREVVAYDGLYPVLNTDFSGWYNAQNFPMTLKQFRDGFFSMVGITQESVTLPNDSMTVEKTIDPTTLTGKDILFAICEVNGRFGHIGRDGKFKYVKLPEITEGLYPADDLYPENTLYPADESAPPINGAIVVKADYESTYCDTISKLTIRDSDDTVGVTIGSGVNEYIVESNFLLFDKSAADLTTIGTNLYNEISNVIYQPCDIDVVGNPCFELGDSYGAKCHQATVRSIILSRTLTGVQAMKDTYIAKGHLTYEPTGNTLQSQIHSLQGKTHVLIVDSEKFYSEIYDGQGNSKIAQNSSAISLEVSRAEGAEGALSGRITVNSNAILAKVTKGESYNGMIISDTGISCTGTGSFVVNMSNLKIDSDGNVEVSGKINASSGSIAGFSITQGAIEYASVPVLYGDGGYIDFGDGSLETYIEGDSVYIEAGNSSVNIRPNAGCEVDCDLEVTGNLSVTGTFSPSNISTSSLSVSNRSAGWEQISYIDGNGSVQNKWFLTG